MVSSYSFTSSGEDLLNNWKPNPSCVCLTALVFFFNLSHLSILTLQVCGRFSSCSLWKHSEELAHSRYSQKDFEETCVLWMKNIPNRLMHCNTWPVVWGCQEGVILLGEVYHKGWALRFQSLAPFLVCFLPLSAPCLQFKTWALSFCCYSYTFGLLPRWTFIPLKPSAETDPSFHALPWW